MKYIVKLERTLKVTQVANMEVDADTPLEAEGQAYKWLSGSNPDMWEEVDSYVSLGPSIEAVTAEGEEVSVAILEGEALDWAVTLAVEPESLAYGNKKWADRRRYALEKGLPDFNWTTNWLIGGPLRERYGISCWREYDALNREAPKWKAENAVGIRCEGPTSMIAVARCIVTDMLGDTVTIPASFDAA